MILRANWLLLVCALLLALEVQLGNLGVIFPSGLFAAFYIGLAFGPRRGIASGMVLAVTVEILLGRAATALPLFLPFAFFLVIYRRFGDRTSILNHAVTGLGLATGYAAYMLVCENVHFRHGWSLLSGPTAIRLFLQGGVAGLVLTPALIRLLDFLAACLEIERFTLQTSGVR